MKTIRIFLASSIVEFADDREMLGSFIGTTLNSIYKKAGIEFELIRCEDFDIGISEEGKQSEYDRAIENSELSVFLFYKKVGTYTRHEFDVALAGFREKHAPKIVTFFKTVENEDERSEEVRKFMDFLGNELNHYYDAYQNVDTLKFKILLQITRMQIGNLPLTAENGAIKLGQDAVVQTSEIPIFQKNDALQDLQSKRDAARERLSEARAAFLASGSEEDGVAFYKASKEYNEYADRVRELEKATLTLANNVAEMTESGKTLTWRQREAVRYFDEGNYDAAIGILQDEEREKELDQAIAYAEEGKRRIQGYVEEELTLIDALRAKGVTAAVAEEIVARYEKCRLLAEKYALDKAFYFGYGGFLSDQKRFYDEETVLLACLEWYRRTQPKESDFAALYNNLGVLYADLGKYDEAEKHYQKSYEIRTRLAEANPDAYEPDLAGVCNNLGIFYEESVRDYRRAERFYAQAAEIYERLAAKHPEVFGEKEEEVKAKLADVRKKAEE